MDVLEGNALPCVTSSGDLKERNQMLEDINITGISDRHSVQEGDGFCFF